MKIWLNIIGTIAVGLAILGVFLPLLPTTPFLLLASACYARGSKRMHAWLLGNKIFGRYLRDFEDGRGIPLRGKIVAVSLMWISIIYSISRLTSVALITLLIVIAIGVTIYLVKFVPLWRAREGDAR
jgi:uncharacterized protein